MKSLPLLWWHEPSKIDMSPREDSPNVLFLGSGIAALTLDELLMSGVKIKRVIAPCKDDELVESVRLYNLPYNISLSIISKREVDLTNFLNDGIDYAVVAFTDQIIKNTEKHPTRIIGVHASDLPKYRGGDPIRMELFNGETRTAIVTYLLREGIDNGPILLREGLSLRHKPKDLTDVSRENYSDEYENYLENYADKIYNEIAKRAGRLLAKTLFNIKRLSREAKEQKGDPTYSRELKKEDLTIDWKTQEAKLIFSRSRIQSVMYTSFQEHPVILSGLYPLEYSPSKSKPGDIILSKLNKRYSPCIVTCDEKTLHFSDVCFEERRLSNANLYVYLRTKITLNEKPRFE